MDTMLSAYKPIRVILREHFVVVSRYNELVEMIDFTILQYKKNLQFFL